MASIACGLHEGRAVEDGASDILKVIKSPGAELAIWSRSLDVDLATLLETVDLDAIDDLEVELALPELESELPSALLDAGYSPLLATRLAADIGKLARLYASACSADRLVVKLSVVETDACRRFHADYVTYRMLTTYRGQGTQWRRADSPDTVEQMAAGDVAIFKGRLLQTEPLILHRSPPIETTGEQRLLLVIDPAAPTPSP